MVVFAASLMLAPMAKADDRLDATQYCPTPTAECQYSYLSIIDALGREGYRIVNVRNTLLNRIQVTAQSPTELRELVIRKSDGSLLLDRVTRSPDPFENTGWSLW
ncbi:hypothetical protein [Anianabacter salinae]|uniref:hypothetical protein n=1 Tax=Anianabacter salinae TaxID=2851023 RepID=UPI00225DD2FE|nr:hypothetical protein [Anianabacter salinae]MBV0913632.1 hypothetical protein [Anianabacter salinae]